MDFSTFNMSSAGGDGPSVPGPYLEWLAQPDFTWNIQGGSFALKGPDAQNPKQRVAIAPQLIFDPYNARVGWDCFQPPMGVPRRVWARAGTLNVAEVPRPSPEHKPGFLIPALVTMDGQSWTRVNWNQSVAGARTGFESLIQLVMQAIQGGQAQMGLLPMVQCVGVEQVPGGRGANSKPTVAPKLQIVQWLDRAALGGLLPDETPLSDGGAGTVLAPQPVQAPQPQYPPQPRPTAPINGSPRQPLPAQPQQVPAPVAQAAQAVGAAVTMHPAGTFQPGAPAPQAAPHMAQAVSAPAAPQSAPLSQQAMPQGPTMPPAPAASQGISVDQFNRGPAQAPQPAAPSVPAGVLNGVDGNASTSMSSLAADLNDEIPF